MYKTTKLLMGRDDSKSLYLHMHDYVIATVERKLGAKLLEVIYTMKEIYHELCLI